MSSTFNDTKTKLTAWKFPCERMNNITFNNLKLLGFNPMEMERKWRIIFDKDMFRLPNKKGSEVVLLFLFDCLDPEKTKTRFRDCWSVADKKQEQEFQKICTSWLTSIAADEKNIKFPRILRSLFASPGAEKFCYLLFTFSQHVLHKKIGENGGKHWQLGRSQASETRQHRHLLPSMMQVHQAGAIQHRILYFEELKKINYMQNMWRDTSIDMVKEYRSVCKDNRELETRLETEYGISKSSLSNDDADDVNTCVQGIDDVNRTTQIQQVRDLWKEVDSLRDSCMQSTKMLTSVISGDCDKYGVDGRDLRVTIPQALLHQCQEEIYRRKIGNVYEDGKVNLVSLIQLWNLSLYLYLEKLQQEPIPDFVPKVNFVQSQEELHQAQLTHAQKLRQLLSEELLVDLKKDIKDLEAKLSDKIHAEGPTTTSEDYFKTLNASLKKFSGFGLMPPTPPLNFQSGDNTTPSGLRLGWTSMPQSAEASTPEAAQLLLESLINRARFNRPSAINYSPILQPASASSYFAVSQLPLSKTTAKKASSAVAASSTINSSQKSTSQKWQRFPAFSPRTTNLTSISQKEMQNDHMTVSSSHLSPKRAMNSTAEDLLVDELVQDVLRSPVLHYTPASTATDKKRSLSSLWDTSDMSQLLSYPAPTSTSSSTSTTDIHTLTPQLYPIAPATVGSQLKAFSPPGHETRGTTLAGGGPPMNNISTCLTTVESLELCSQATGTKTFLPTSKSVNLLKGPDDKVSKTGDLLNSSEAPHLNNSLPTKPSPKVSAEARIFKNVGSFVNRDVNNTKSNRFQLDQDFLQTIDMEYERLSLGPTCDTPSPRLTENTEEMYKLTDKLDLAGVNDTSAMLKTDFTIHQLDGLHKSFLVPKEQLINMSGEEPCDQVSSPFRDVVQIGGVEPQPQTLLSPYRQSARGTPVSSFLDDTIFRSPYLGNISDEDESILYKTPQ